MTEAERKATETIAKLLTTMRDIDARLNRCVTVLLDQEKRIAALEKPTRLLLPNGTGVRLDA